MKKRRRKTSYYIKKQAAVYGDYSSGSGLRNPTLYWMVRSSFMKNTDIYSMRPFVFWPKEMLWSNYTDALKAADFGRYAINTITIVAGCLIGTLLTSSMAAYAFSRIKWKGQGFCFALVLSTMMLPGSVTLIPQFMIWRNFHMIDTYWPLILPSFFGGGAFNIFLLRQFFLGMTRAIALTRCPHDFSSCWQKSALVVVALFYLSRQLNDTLFSVSHHDSGTQRLEIYAGFDLAESVAIISSCQKWNYHL